MQDHQELWTAFEDDFMKLVLTYRGSLPPTGDHNKHVKLKNKIRREFHRQLIYHWKRNGFLSDFYPTEERLATMPTKKDARRSSFFKSMVGKFQFVPLVLNSPSLRLICELDIHFARRDEPGEIMHNGDLDNRIKTLFDALRMPDNPTELPADAEPLEGETPFFCLLEDDQLITKFSVSSEHLLEAPRADEKETDVSLTIYVNIMPNHFGRAISAFQESFPA